MDAVGGLLAVAVEVGLVPLGAVGGAGDLFGEVGAVGADGEEGSGGGGLRARGGELAVVVGAPCGCRKG